MPSSCQALDRKVFFGNIQCNIQFKLCLKKAAGVSVQLIVWDSEIGKMRRRTGTQPKLNRRGPGRVPQLNPETQPWTTSLSPWRFQHLTRVWKHHGLMVQVSRRNPGSQRQCTSPNLIPWSCASRMSPISHSGTIQIFSWHYTRLAAIFWKRKKGRQSLSLKFNPTNSIYSSQSDLDF